MPKDRGGPFLIRNCSSLCPFCVPPRLTAFDFPSFFNDLEWPLVRALFLLSYCRSCIFVRFAATSVG